MSDSSSVGAAGCCTRDDCLARGSPGGASEEVAAQIVQAFYDERLNFSACFRAFRRV